ncbi:MAG: PLP-dependent aminotransferase family protein [Candidatus Melainabacteria bacterium]|nr:PLP-dependent aminotransferase family protein [Candidatus Melainabacteria bacterium]
MKTSFADIPIILGSSDKPLFIELYEILRDAILDGRLEGGQVLPSTRDLARKLGVSRHTVLKSTKLLVTQGYLDSVDQSLKVFHPHSSAAASVEDGADVHFTPEQHVAYDCNAVVSEPISAEFVSRFAENLMSSKKSFRFPEMNFAPTAEDPTPLEQWQRIFVNRAKEVCTDYDVAPLGHEALRIAISKYVNRFRSLKCKPANVVIFAGPTAALDFIGRLMLDAGDSILMENPGFKHARNVFSTFRAQIDTVDVDGDGVVVSRLKQYPKKAKFLYVTPAHQNPTGATMSLERRRELLSWSAHTGTTIIEDGYDSEYWHRKSRPVPAIQGLDENDSVIYLASFWRVLLPVTRISFAVFPDKWMDLVQKFKAVLERDVNLLEQQVLAEFIEKGLYERALRKNQRVLSYRRQQLVISLMRHFGQKVSIATEDSGTNLLVTFKSESSDEEIEDAAYTANLPLISTGSYYVSGAVPKQFLLPFSNIKDECIDAIISAFAKLVLPVRSMDVAATPFVPPMSRHDPFRSFVGDYR